MELEVWPKGAAQLPPVVLLTVLEVDTCEDLPQGTVVSRGVCVTHSDVSASGTAAQLVPVVAPSYFAGFVHTAHVAEGAASCD